MRTMTPRLGLKMKSNVLCMPERLALAEFGVSTDNGKKLQPCMNTSTIDTQFNQVSGDCSQVGVLSNSILPSFDCDRASQI
jgi:putative ubiquitin-RnfH superfamily antitoxin RatB of RatAB toxin-antitoxin module